MNFMYALAGGFGQAADAYSEEQKAQRTYKLEQAGADAELQRKQNFARFGVDIDAMKDKNRSQTALEEHKGKAEIDEGFKPSGYVDEKTGRELSKAELEKRGNAEGLIPKDEYDSGKKTEREINARKALSKATEEEVIAEYGKDSKEHKRWKDKKYGVAESEISFSKEEKRQRDMEKSVSQFKTGVTERSDGLVKNGYNKKAADAVSLIVNFDNATDEIKKEFGKDPNNVKKYNEAKVMKELSETVAGMSPSAAREELKKKNPKMPDRIVTAILEMANIEGNLGENTIWEDTKDWFANLL